MQTDWLIDFVTMAETRSFSRAAQLRQVTQPAFSRRIQALEAWAGVTLVDRNSHPPALTDAGKFLCHQAPALVQAIQHARAVLRNHALGDGDVIRFAALPTLASHFFPQWLTRINNAGFTSETRIEVLDTANGLNRLSEGHCDLLLTYQSDQPESVASMHAFDQMGLGSERLIPCSRPDALGEPLHRLSGREGRTVAYLAYAASSSMGKLVEGSLLRTGNWLHLTRRFECDSAQSLLAMALEGHGLAFLPESVARGPLKEHLLVTAGESLDTVLGICLLRSKSDPSAVKPSACDRLWRLVRDLSQQPPVRLELDLRRLARSRQELHQS